MNPINRAHRSLERNPNLYQANDLNQKDINRFLFWFAGYVITLFIFTAFVIYDANAQDINSLTPDASITTEMAELIKPPLEQLKEVPPVDSWPVVPMPDIDDLSKYKSGSGQELFIYGMMTAMVERADRENAECQKQLDAGYKPCYFKTIKPRDHYAKIWLDDYNALQVKNKENLERLARDSVKCIGGFEIYSDSGLCSMFASHQEAEQNYYHAKLSVYQLSLANQELQVKCGATPPTAKICIDQGSIKDGSGGFLWKAVADPKARCKNGTTILLSKDQVSIKEIELLDANQTPILKPAYYGLLSDGRPRFCAEGRPGSSFSGPIYVKYGQNCKTVTSPANRED